MRISVNGETHDVKEQTTIAQLLSELGKNPKFLAVERNRELIPRAKHSDCALEEGDELEIVTLVGGG
ncbi:hypothetical protein KOR42_29960 [Thalassoglobus neptunius]|uniref:Sulfur carrier protein ThiS n=1 Tax=Thalassoglobus neptunius TaxID=1938619 RepID=A0A5C5WPF5_9PLAN|nr:sulfur carrier protein ThiS [Thalassoglobus neptunius]TWT52310.1 hypothetical protein KOR42_29960 [Thalassoglobus neptunius]